MNLFSNRLPVTLTLLIALLLPLTAEATVFCQRTVTGVRMTDIGRIQLRSKDTASNSNETLLTLCSTRIKLGTIEPDTCGHFYTQLLAALHTSSTISIQLRDSELDAGGLWQGTCSTLTNWTNLSSAIVSFENQE